MGKICLTCGKNIGILAPKAMLSDGYICANCWKSVGMGISFADFSSGLQYSSNDIKNMINEQNKNESLIESFAMTTKIGNILEFSSDSETFIILNANATSKKKELFCYNQILDFELLEDGASITQGGLGRAIVGEFLFGDTGAVVGAVTGRKKTKSLCNSLKLKITFRECYRQTIYIDLITTQTKTSSIKYKMAYRTAQDALSALQIACDQISKKSPESNNTFSEADELAKFKKLLDDGVINKEEFDVKKKQILGL